MSDKLSNAIETIRKFQPDFFISKVEFKDPLHEEIYNDTLMWANFLMDSIPVKIACETNIHEIIQEKILGRLTHFLIQEEYDKSIHNKVPDFDQIKRSKNVNYTPALVCKKCERLSFANYLDIGPCLICSFCFEEFMEKNGIGTLEHINPEIEEAK